MNTETEKLECLWTGDPRVCTLLGRQKPPAEGERIRRSCFVYALYLDGWYILFNTLTRQILKLPPQYVDYFLDDRLFPASVLAEEVAAILYEGRFLVPEHEPESQTYLELKDVLVIKEELPRGITQYVILPTATCNARCFYCFEQGMHYQKMNAETVENTVRFIIRHKPSEAKKIHIHWFGGEPMCAADNIERICSGLTEAGIDYDAEMTSNGSLFNKAYAKRAAEVWKVSQIQITLDGMKEEYNRRKRYTGAFQDPFGTVIRNVHLLIAAGISVTIRLNADENNLGELYRVVRFLLEEFCPEERKKLKVYAHTLFSQAGDGLDACPAGAGADALEARVMEINDYILRKGLTARDLKELFMLKSHFCMTTAPECNVLIDAAGQLFACDAMTENMRYGDVISDVDPKAWSRVTAPCTIRKECSQCVFLPQCTEFDRCPNRTAYDNCFRQEKRRLDDELRFAYFVYQDGKRRAAEAIEQKEGRDVPD